MGRHHPQGGLALREILENLAKVAHAFLIKPYTCYSSDSVVCGRALQPAIISTCGRVAVAGLCAFPTDRSRRIADGASRCLGRLNWGAERTFRARRFTWVETPPLMRGLVGRFRNHLHFSSQIAGNLARLMQRFSGSAVVGGVFG